jgi:O-acetyl-ADP-ribose deacetylase
MKIELINGDITKVKCDVIVNAANTSLLGGGGVDGAIHKAGGKAILDDCIKIRNRQGGCSTGEAVITSAGQLDAKYVIHTVGPVYNTLKDTSDLLSNCYVNSLVIAIDHNARSIAFPNISTGIYRYPKEIAAEIAIKTVMNFEGNSTIEIIYFVCFDDENYKIYKEKLNVQI